MNIINFTQPVIDNFLVKIINGLVTATSVAVGVILFTLILKAITLPFDFMSRVSMRKNSLKMEEMRPELEKLQKQYADNKDLYNQKMMALYKKNGYSMFGACLPTIITLVIFIVAINGFTSFSKYQNTRYFYDMSVAYNNVVYSGLEVDGEYITRDESGKIIVNDSEVYNKSEITPEGKDFTIYIESGNDGGNDYFKLYTTDSYVNYIRYFSEKDGVVSFGTITYSPRVEGLTSLKLAGSENNNLKAENGLNYAEWIAENPELTASEFILDIEQTMSAITFRNNGSKFLWVKNIWMQDSPMAHPVDYAVFGTNNGSSCSCDCSCTGTYEPVDEEKSFAPLTAKLTEEKESANGYFILIVLTAASSLLTQIIMSKSQKAQMELQTVDGQGAQQQKLMTWMMPIMMAIFSFMYTAAFSIYIILNSMLSVLTTLVINYFVDKKYKKIAEEKATEKVRSVSRKKYNPEEEAKKQEEQKKKKNQNKIPDNDFLSGKADKKKHIRGRLK